MTMMKRQVARQKSRRAAVKRNTRRQTAPRRIAFARAAVGERFAVLDDGRVFPQSHSYARQTFTKLLPDYRGGLLCTPINTVTEKGVFSFEDSDRVVSLREMKRVSRTGANRHRSRGQSRAVLREARLLSRTGATPDPASPAMWVRTFAL